MRFTIYQDSHVGGRKNNQDRLAYSYSRDVLLMVIADGMGGHARGEIAAEVTVNTITTRFQQEAATGVLRRPREFLESAINAAHRAIVAHADRNDMLECPRTTVVACIIQKGRATWAHSGDSRLYLFRDGKLLTATEDHSRVQQLISAGVLTPAQAAVHPERNKIYNCLGGVLPPGMTISDEIGLHVGDSLVLSTDGFWGPLDSANIATRLTQSDVLTLVPQLLDEAETKAGADSDNLSVIALTWERQEDEPAAATVTSTDPVEGFTTSIRNTTQLPITGAEVVTDADIERAILEIQDALKKVSR